MFKRTRIQSLFLTVLFTFALCIGTASTVSAASTPVHHIVNPIRQRTHAEQVIWVCLLWHESRSTIAHPNMGDQWGIRGDYGPLQIAPITWNKWAPYVHVAPGLRSIQTASFITEQKVAIEIQEHDGWGPWHGDGCV